MRAMSLLLLLLSACSLAKDRNPQPSADKPFEGEWRVCYGNDGKSNCESYFWLQHGKRICGTWNSDGHQGLLQAEMVPHGTFSKNDPELNQEDFANIRYICGPNTHNGLANMPCGADASAPMDKLNWQASDWTLRTCKERRGVGISPPYRGFSSICPTESPLEMNTFHRLDKNERDRLLGMQWLRQCLSGEAPSPIKINKPQF